MARLVMIHLWPNEALGRTGCCGMLSKLTLQPFGCTIVYDQLDELLLNSIFHLVSHFAIS